LNWASLLFALIILLSSIALNVLGVRKTLPYAILGLALWFALLNSGIHATIAGVLLAMTIPARSKMDQNVFKNKTGDLIRDFPDTPVEIMVVDESQENL
jgi:Na+:H+ antiporter, NhaA family